MTRRLFTFVPIFLTVILIGMVASCTKTGDYAGNTEVGVATGSTNGKTDFPPLASTIANADIELVDGSITKAGDKKGKVILLNLWGIWCGPCRAEMPHLVEMQEAFRDQGFEIIGLNIGDEDTEPESFENIQKFAKEMKLNYTLGRISTTTSTDFYRLTNFPGVPQSVLVDREGRMRGVFQGGSRSVVNKMKETVASVVNEAG